MNPPADDPQQTPAPAAAPGSTPAAADPDRLSGLVLTGDLMFSAKVRGTGSDLGYRMLVASNMFIARSLIGKWRPRVVFVDLTAGEVATPGALRTFQEISGPGTWFIAAGPHVDAAALAAAKAAGCQVVMPRSKFSAELPELMRRYFSEPANQADPATSAGPGSRSTAEIAESEIPDGVP